MASSLRSMASYLCMIVFIFSTLTSISQAQLSGGFYFRRCRNLVPTVRTLVQDIVGRDRRMGAALLRLHFHDCFVNGCDASVLLDVPGGEKESVHNVNSLIGFDVIDNIKFQVEAMCPGVVSCADIVALVARESVVALGGPSWPVLHGRRDSRTSATSASADSQLPFGNDNVRNLIRLFAGKGFTAREMVALSGAHTIGQARCIRFRGRIYGGQNIAPTFAQSMQQICPLQGGDDNLGPLDFTSPTDFNNDYYEGLTRREGLLISDQVLFDRGTQTRPIVQQYANNEQKFFTDFANAMFKMSKLGVRTGNAGMIRKECRFAR